MASIAALMVRLGGDSGQLISALSAGGGSIRAFTNTVGLGANKIGGFWADIATAAVVATTASVVAFAQFDQAMTESLAIGEGVNSAMRKDMEDTAKAISTHTKYSATEVAKGYYALTSAGLEAQQSLKTIGFVAEFAQAGVMDVAKASDFLTSSLAGFQLDSKNPEEYAANMKHVGDVLTRVNSLAIGNLNDFATALNNGPAAMAASLGKSVEETVAVLGAFATVGTKGAAAGTALGMVWRDLQTKAVKNADAFEHFGVKVFDANGQMRNTADILDDLGKAYEKSDLGRKKMQLDLGLTDRSAKALTQIMGQGNNIRAMEKNLGGADADNATHKVAQAQMQSFGNRMAAMWHQVENAAIDFGAVIAPWIMSKLEDLGTWLSDHKDDFKAIWEVARPALETMGKGIGVVLGGIGEIIKRVRDLITFFTNSKTAMLALAAAAGLILIAWAPVIGATLAWAVTITAVISILGILKDHWREVFNYVMDKLTDIGNGILKAFKWGIDGVLDLFPGLKVAIAAVAGTVDFIYEHWEAVKNIILETLALMPGVTKKPVDNSGKNSTTLGGFFAVTGTDNEGSFGSMDKLIDSFWDKNTNKAKISWGDIGKIAAGVFDFGFNPQQSSIEFIQDMGLKSIDAHQHMKEWLDWLVGKFPEAEGTVYDLEKQFGYFKTNVSNAIDWVKGKFEELGDTIGNAIERGLNKARESVPWLFSLGDVVGKIMGAGTKPSDIKIPTLEAPKVGIPGPVDIEEQLTRLAIPDINAGLKSDHQSDLDKILAAQKPKLKLNGDDGEDDWDPKGAKKELDKLKQMQESLDKKIVDSHNNMIADAYMKGGDKLVAITNNTWDKMIAEYQDLTKVFEGLGMEHFDAANLAFDKTSEKFKKMAEDIKQTTEGMVSGLLAFFIVRNTSQGMSGAITTTAKGGPDQTVNKGAPSVYVEHMYVGTNPNIPGGIDAGAASHVGYRAGVSQLGGNRFG